MMLGRISIDIVEIVIVKSDNYEIYRELKTMLSKLSESKRVARINDKLTKVYHHSISLEYRLHGMGHREYDKPSLISTTGKHLYEKYDERNRDIGYQEISVYNRISDSERFYKHITCLHIYLDVYTKSHSKIDLL